MPVNIGSTRAAISTRWIRASLAALLLASSASLLAQNAKDQEKKAPPPHQKTAPANPPAAHSATPAPPPANSPARSETRDNRPAPQNPPAASSNSSHGVSPAQTGNPSRPAVTNPSAPTPVRQPANTGSNPNPSGATPPSRQVGSGGNSNPSPGAQPASNQNSGRGPNVPNTPAGRQFGSGGNSNPSPGAQPASNQNSGRGPNVPTAPAGRQFGSGGNSNPSPGAQPASNQNSGRGPNVPTAPAGRQFGSGANSNNGRGPNVPATRTGPPPVYHGPNNSEVHYRSNGQPQTVRARGITITHTPSGVRRAVVERPDHTVIVTSGAGHGYVQRPFAVRNVSYVQRTYYVSGVSYTRVYRPYAYHGMSLNLYVSSRYYAPAYYGWAYSPWATPVVYRWGWYRDPWLAYYGGYFTPYPSYGSAAFWLTDYIIATTLQSAYQERMDAAAAQANAGYGNNAGGPAALTPEVKQAIADEVRRQLDQERAEGQSMSQAAAGAPSFLTDNSAHVFVVAGGLDVMSRWGECTLTEGDVLQMSAPPPPAAVAADLTVLASKGLDCRKGSVVALSIPDLQDMQNHLRETLDQGLGDLQSRQGQGGLPAPPPAAQRPPVEAPYAAAAPPPDPNIANELTQQSQEATQAEGEVLNQAQSAPQANAGAPATVTVGMTIDQVVSILGQPQTIGDLGSKKTYFYGNMKVVFTDGKVTGIE